MTTPRKTGPEPQVAHPDNPEPMQEDEITTTAHLLGNREIEVEPIREAPRPPDAQGMVEIRMNTTLEDFTYGNPHIHIRLDAGKRYRVPVHIAQYLDGLGYVWH